jgi:kynurenine formamidase
MLIDVSQKIEAGSIYRFGSPPVEIRAGDFFHEEEGRYQTTLLSFPAHTATHVDLVYSSNRLAPERMIGKGKLLDVTPAGRREIGIADIEGQVEIEPGDFVFFRTDWCRYLGSETYYQHPELALELVHWLASKKINMVGIDALGLGLGKKHGEFDRYLAAQNIFVIENLANLDAVPAPVFTVYCFPLSLEAIDAIPARVMVETLEDSS